MLFNAAHKGIIGWAFPILLCAKFPPTVSISWAGIRVEGIPLINLFADA